MQCEAITKNGNRCTRKPKIGSFCFQHTLNKKKSQKLSLKKLFSMIFIIGTGLIFIGDLFDLFDLGKPWNKYVFNPVNSYFNSPSFSSNAVFNIAILPFFPTKECVIENTEYEKQLILRLQELGIFSGNFIESLLIENKDCPLNDIAAIDIGLEYDADMVIWGYYDEDCDTENKIRIKYNLVNKSLFIGDIPDNGDSGFKSFTSPVEFMNGELNQDMEHLLYWIVSSCYYYSKDYNSAYSFINKISNSNCSESIWATKINCIINLSEDEALALRTLDSISTCQNQSDFKVLVDTVISNRRKEILNSLKKKAKVKILENKIQAMEKAIQFSKGISHLNDINIQIDSIRDKNNQLTKNYKIKTLVATRDSMQKELRISRDSVYYFSKLILKDTPNDVDVFIYLSSLEKLNNNALKAMEHIEKCLVLEPTNARAIEIKKELIELIEK